MINNILFLLGLIASCNGLWKHHMQHEEDQSIQEAHASSITVHTDYTLLKQLNEYLENPESEKFIELLNSQPIDETKKWINNRYGKPFEPLLNKAISYYHCANRFDNEADKNQFIQIISALIEHPSVDVNQIYCGEYAYKHLIDFNLYTPLKLLIKRIDAKIPFEIFDLIKHAYGWPNIELIVLQSMLQKGEIIKGHNDYSGILKWAVENNFIALTKHLLYGEPNSNFDVNHVLNALDKDDYTLLHVAVQKGYVEIIKLLLGCKNINVNLKTPQNPHTPLILAIYLLCVKEMVPKAIEIIEMLLDDQRVDPNSATRNLDSGHKPYNILIRLLRINRTKAIEINVWIRIIKAFLKNNSFITRSDMDFLYNYASEKKDQELLLLLEQHQLRIKK